MSFGRRLALFVLLLVIVPVLALVSILLFVSEDARRGKADARLAAGLETALAVYDQRVADGRVLARELAATPGLGEDVTGGQRDALLSLAREGLARGAVGVEFLGAGGAELAVAGPREAVAFGEVRLQTEGEGIGSVRVSTTTADAYVDEVRQLTNRELVFSRDDAPLAFTVTPPGMLPPSGETADLELAQGEYRARRELLDARSGEGILLLGPRKEGGLLAIGPPTAALLVAFLVLAGLFAFTLARELTGLHERVADQAATDPLTGLWNRRTMSELLAREEERLTRFGRGYSLLVLDLDAFKSVNDRHGHPQGDAVLRGVAEIIDRETRTIDDGIRYGGDELALILPETDAKGAAVLAERLRKGIELAAFELRDGDELGVTVSIGIATAPEAGEDSDTVVQAADDALLEAKRSGKNRIVSAPASTDGSA